jgi:hypothetical protein
MGCRWPAQAASRYYHPEPRRHHPPRPGPGPVGHGRHQPPRPERDDAWQGGPSTPLDGDPTTRRAQPRTATRTLRDLVHAIGIPLWTITVLSKANLDQVDWLLDLARRLRFLCFRVLHHSDQLGHGDASARTTAAARGGRPAVARKRRARRSPRRPPPAAPAALAGFARNRRPPARTPPGGALYNVDVDGRSTPARCSSTGSGAERRRAGLHRRLAALEPAPCGACSATSSPAPVFGLDWQTGWNWVRALRR